MAISTIYEQNISAITYLVHFFCLNDFLCHAFFHSLCFLSLLCSCHSHFPCQFLYFPLLLYYQSLSLLPVTVFFLCVYLLSLALTLFIVTLFTTVTYFIHCHFLYSCHFLDSQSLFYSLFLSLLPSLLCSPMTSQTPSLLSATSLLPVTFLTAHYRWSYLSLT